MTVIAFSLVSSDGEALVTRVYSEESVKGGRPQLESILNAFPKLIDGGAKESKRGQHTFIEAGDVRYLYQPLDDVYLLLITTKSSNILQDAETLRLFSKVVPDYCRPSKEGIKAGGVKVRSRVPSVRDNVFELIFAFDEILSHGGLKEDVTPGQVRSYAVEMFSQEERLFSQIKLSQELAANSAMEEKVREFGRKDREKKEREEREKKLWGQDKIDRSYYY